MFRFQDVTERVFFTFQLSIFNFQVLLFVMKKYIVPEIYVVALETEMPLAISGDKTMSFKLNDNATSVEDFAASQYRSNLWGEE